MFENDDEQGGIATQPSTNDVLDRLRDVGVDEILLGEIEKGYLRQSDYTRKTQQVAQAQRAAEQQAAYAAGLAARGGNQQEDADPVDLMIKELLAGDDSPESRKAAEVLMKVAEATEKRLTRKLQPKVDSLEQATYEAKNDGDLRAYYKEKLLPRYGKEVLDLITPELHSAMVKNMLQGNYTDPEAILRHLHEDKMDSLRDRIRQAKQESRQSRHLEGQVTTRQTTPPMAGLRGTPAKPNGAPAPLSDGDVLRMVQAKLARR